MTRVRNHEATYRAAALFRNECLEGRSSLLWPGAQPWTISNLRKLRSAILDHLDETPRTFFEKLKDQLAPESDDVSRVAADILGFYYLFPVNIGAQTKLSKLGQLVNWKSISNGIDVSRVASAYEEGGIGKTGLYYNTGIPWLFVFLVQFGIGALENAPDLADVGQLQELCDRAQSGIPGSTNAMRNAALHLILPDFFEPIASDMHKSKLLEAFQSYDSHSGSIDERIHLIREVLTNEIGRQDFSFYDDDVISRWKPDAQQETGSIDDSTDSRVWIEKTRIKDRTDRLQGPEALGKALWSPQVSNSGGNIYRFMREVRPGDVVLHLTDNQAFTGRSVVDSVADSDFVGLPNTEWANAPAYRVQLRDFNKIDPPLDRQSFFGEPYKSQLRRIAESGTKNLFFNKEPSLNQGAYLTPAPLKVVQILSEAYAAQTGTSLLGDSTKPMVATTLPKRIDQNPIQVKAVCDSFSSSLRASGVVFGARHDAIVRSFVSSLATKRFVILTGLSGSGKTQLALKFGEWLGGDRSLVVAVRPDWTGSDALFGYEDALQRMEQGRRSWHVPEALRFMLRAAHDHSRPYLLVLDEMNLAHVERYFADVLSGIESEQPVLPNLEVGLDGHWRLVSEAAEKLRIPQNLLVVGTVNVDETTYMFSPKVLDRANTFEFRVNTEDLMTDARRPTMCEAGSEDLVASFAAIASDPDWHDKYPATQLPELLQYLRQLHALLSKLGFEFGHRTFVEAKRFAAI